MIATVGAPGEVISGPPGDLGEPGSQGPAVSAKFHYTDRTRPDQTRQSPRTCRRPRGPSGHPKPVSETRVSD